MGESRNRAGEERKTAKEEKKEKGVMEAVFKMNKQCGGCKGCAHELEKLVKFVRAFDGVKTAETNLEHGEIKVVGEIDPLKLVEEIKKKKKINMTAKWKVELEPPKKDEDRRGGGGDEKVFGKTLFVFRNLFEILGSAPAKLHLQINLNLH